MKYLTAALISLQATCLTAGPLPDPQAEFRTASEAEIELGQLLFFDPILSGNRNMACASCHHPRFGTSDGMSLGIGEGAVGIGPDLKLDPDNRPEQRIPRNSPALWNLGAVEFTSLFHDGRLQEDAGRPSGLRTPLGEDMASGFNSALAAQAMFPVLSGDEMAGHYSENEVSRAVRQGLLTGPDGAWALLAARVDAIPAYRAAFDPIIGARPIAFTDIGNVIADFIAFEFRADQSPFDLYLRGEGELPENALRGMELFYGEAGCSACHSGLFQTDQGFHAIAMPQIGPGKAASFETHNRDHGRMRVTGDPVDAYRFRTPSLRNLSVTGPYGHTGSFATIEATVRHHLDPVESLRTYDPGQAILPDLPGSPDFVLMSKPDQVEDIAAANELDLPELDDTQVADILAFLATLTDAASLKGRLGIPDVVPSGLKVPR